MRNPGTEWTRDFSAGIRGLGLGRGARDLVPRSLLDPAPETTDTARPPLPAGAGLAPSCLQADLRGPLCPTLAHPEWQKQLPPVTNVLRPQSHAQPLSPRALNDTIAPSASHVASSVF